MCNYIRKKYHSVCNYYVRYIQNNITKHFLVRILNFTKCVKNVFDLVLLHYPPPMKDEEFDDAYWNKHDEHFEEDVFIKTIMDGLPKLVR